jgi:HEAT repeat protein
MSPKRNVSENKGYKLAVEVANHMISAYKSLLLYPPANPIPMQAIERLVNSLNDFLGYEGELRFNFEREGIYFRKELIGSKEAVELSRVARVRGVGGVSFFPGVRLDEILVLLQALGEEPDEILARGGIAQIVWEAGSGNILVHESEKKLVEVEEGIVEQVEDEEVNIFQDIMSKDYSELKIGEKKILIRFLDQPLQLAKFISSLSFLGEGATKEEVETQIKKVFELLKKAVSVIREEHEERQEHLLRDIAEALLLLPERILKEIFSFSGDDEIKGVLAQILGEMGASEIGEEIGRLLEPSQFQYLLAILEESGASRRFVEEVEKIWEEETGKKLEFGDFKLSVKEKKVDHQARINRIVEFMETFTEEERERLRHTNTVLSEKEVSRHFILTLIDLMFLAPDFKTFDEMVTKLEDVTLTMVKQGKFEEGKLVLQALREKHSREGSLKEYGRVEKALKKLASPALVAEILEKMTNFSVESETYNLILSYFALLDREAAIESLIEILGKEKKMSNRKLVCNILSQLGMHHIDLLTSYLDDPRWFLVRNVVNVLGWMEREEVIPPLAKASHHHDKRVRIAVIRALSRQKSRETAKLIGNMLRDKEPAVVELAARALGWKGNEIGADYLIGFLNEGSLLGELFSAKLAAIESLGIIGLEKSLPFLRAILRKKFLFAPAKGREIKERVRKAISLIEKE